MLKVLFLIFALGMQFASAQVTTCQSTAYIFPNAQQSSDYITYNGTFQNLTDATVCLIVKPTITERQRAILSYTRSGHTDQLRLYFQQRRLEVIINGESSNHTSPVNLNGREFHLCVWFSSATSSVGIFIDGEPQATQTYTGGHITGGGNLIIGQDAGNFPGHWHFDSTKAFSGEMSNFYMWPRVLNVAEVQAMSFQCTCPSDYTVSLAGSNGQLHGAVSPKTPSCPSFQAQTCEILTMTFPNPDQIVDYVRYTGTVPTMRQASVCMWINSFDRVGTSILSYAASGEDNELALWFTAEQTLRIWYRGQVLNYATTVGVKDHICLTLDTSNGRMAIYVAGKYVAGLTFSGRSSIRGGGYLVIGQDHDAVSISSPRFSASQAYSGEVTNVVIWDSLLTAIEIHDMYVGCSCPANPTIQLTNNNIEVFGSAFLSVPSTCPNGEPLLDYEGCRLSLFTFPNDNQATDYVQALQDVPDFEEFTFCTWYRQTNFNPNKQTTLLSYANRAESNAVLLMISNTELYTDVNSDVVRINIGRPTGETFHLCFAVSSISSERRVFIDGVSVGSGPYTRGTIVGGGRMLLGQDQDALSTASNPQLDGAQAFRGEMGNPTIWSRALSESEVLDIATRCLCPNQRQMFLHEGNVRTFGAANSSRPTACTTLTGENECLSAPCDKYAACNDTTSSYLCDCNQGFNGNGTTCSFVPTTTTSPNTQTPLTVNGSDIVVQCSPYEIQLFIPVYLAKRFNANLGTLHLRNSTCSPTLSPDNSTYRFTISGNLANQCGTRIERNSTHILYTNEVLSFIDRNQPILTGATFSIPFGCAFPAIGHVISINYTVVIITATVIPPSGGGAFQLSSQIFSDETFQSSQTKTSFDTTDFLFVQIGIGTRDPTLAAVVHRCWGTPTANINDPTQYDIIVNRCPVPGAVANTVKMIENGNSNRARFEAQVFAFSNDNVIYLHCEVAVCDSTAEVCVPICPSARRRRDTRVRRQAPAGSDVAYQTLGPFYRVVPDTPSTSTSTTNSLMMGGILGAVIILLIAVLVIVGVKFYVAGGRRSSSSRKVILDDGVSLSDVKGVVNPALKL